MLDGTRRGEAYLAIDDIAGHWHAIRTRPQHEIVVAQRLQSEGVETFWPTYRERVEWSDRERIAIRSLFPGYLFARFTGALIHVAGSLQILQEPVESGQIESIRRALATNAAVSPCPYVAGETVLVRRGPFAGCEGIIERVKGARRLIIRIDVLRRAVAVELDTSVVRRNEQKRDRHSKTATEYKARSL